MTLYGERNTIILAVNKKHRILNVFSLYMFMFIDWAMGCNTLLPRVSFKACCIRIALIWDERVYVVLTSIYTYKTWILYLCLCVCSRFPKPPKVPGSWNYSSRPTLGQLDLLWANLKHDGARFSKFWFLRLGSPYGPVLKKWLLFGCPP